MAELPDNYNPQQSDFAVPNVEPSDVLDRWNVAFKALATNSASYQEPIVSYPYQFYADPEQDAIMQRNGSATAYLAAFPLNNSTAFEASNLGLTATGALRRTTSFTNISRAIARTRTSSQFQYLAGTDIAPTPSTPYTIIDRTSTSAPSNTAGHLLATSQSSAKLFIDATTRFLVEFQVAGVAQRFGHWIISANVNNASTNKYFPFYIPEVTTLSYSWRPFLFRGSFWLNQAGSAMTTSPTTVTLRASFADAAVSGANQLFLHPGQMMLPANGGGYVRTQLIAVARQCSIILREVAQ